MMPVAPDQEPGSAVRLPWVITVVILCFVAATGFVHWQMRAIDRAAIEIADNAAPSIEHLASARVEARRLETVLRENLEGRGRGGPALDAAAIADSQRALDQSLDAYQVLPVLPGERQVRVAVLHAAEALDGAVARFARELGAGDVAAAAITLHGPVAAAVAQLNGAITRTIQLDANRVHDAAVEIREVRASSTYVAVLLDVACTLIALAGAIAIRRAARAHAELRERNRRSSPP